jgi:hypothetical protein
MGEGEKEERIGEAEGPEARKIPARQIAANVAQDWNEADA